MPKYTVPGTHSAMYTKWLRIGLNTIASDAQTH